MSTICKIIVANGNIDGVIHACRDYLGKDSSTEVLSESTSHLYPRFDKLFINEIDHPTHLFIGAVSEDVVEVHFNSFGYCSDLASMLSERLQCSVFVVIYQSTAEAGYFSLHKGGRKRRSIEFGEGELSEQEGELLDFESEPLGHDIGDGDEEYFVFDSDDIDDYLENLNAGTSIYGAEPAEWTLVYVLHKSPGRASIRAEKGKPWWKIW